MPSSYADINPKVSAAALAGLLTAILVPILKQRYGLDLSGQDGNVQVLLSVAAAYWMPAK